MGPSRCILLDGRDNWLRLASNHYLRPAAHGQSEFGRSASTDGMMLWCVVVRLCYGCVPGDGGTRPLRLC